MTHDVFISYTSANKSIADQMCNQLENNGIRVWYAPRDIVSKDYAGAIVNAINQARVFSLILGGKSSHSDHVLNEIALAHERIKEGLTILPIRIDMEDLSSSSQYYLNRQHWLDATTPPLEKQIELYCLNVEACLGDTNPKNGKISLNVKKHKPDAQEPEYIYSNPRSEYLYDISSISISSALKERIEKALIDGQSHINNAEGRTFRIGDLAWIKSFISIVREIDPLGFSGQYSNEQSESLVGEWHRAQYHRYSSYDIEKMKLTTHNLNTDIFGNYLAVIFSLQSGRAKVVLKRSVNPNSIKGQSSYENPLDKYVFEFGLVEPANAAKSDILKKLESGRRYIDDVANGNIGTVQMAWIKSFISMVREIDPLGVSGNYSNEQSNSLIGEWHGAQYHRYSIHEIEIMKLTANDLNTEVFWNYLSVVYSLLIGKARIVLDRTEIR